MLRGPRPEGLGNLSARYESGPKGTSAIGYDEGGGASYGKYQLAYLVGGLKAFLSWLAVPYPNLYNALMPLYSSAGNHPRRNPGPFLAKWLELAKGKELPAAEHEYIVMRYYDVPYSGMGEGPRTMVDNCRALQDVLLSTGVQHGPGKPGSSRGAIGIFNGCYHEGISPADYIDAIYSKRGTYLSKLKQSTRAAVLNRYADERKRAKAMLSIPVSKPTEAEAKVGAGPLDKVRGDIQNGGSKP